MAVEQPVRIQAADAFRSEAELFDTLDLTRMVTISDLGQGTVEMLQEAAELLCRAYPSAAAGDLRARTKQRLSYISRLLNGRHISDADLVLTATRAHRAEVVSLVPRASRYTFTLVQFAALLQQIDDDDIEDPYRQRDEVYERVGAQIDNVVAPIADRLKAVLR